MTPRICRGKPPKDTSEKQETPPPVEDDEDDGDIATPKRDRDDEADALENH